MLQKHWQWEYVMFWYMSTHEACDAVSKPDDCGGYRSCQEHFVGKNIGKKFSEGALEEGKPW